jgi:hypothetical protein
MPAHRKRADARVDNRPQRSRALASPGCEFVDGTFVCRDSASGRVQLPDGDVIRLCDYHLTDAQREGRTRDVLLGGDV